MLTSYASEAAGSVVATGCSAGGSSPAGGHSCEHPMLQLSRGSPLLQELTPDSQSLSAEAVITATEYMPVAHVPSSAKLGTPAALRAPTMSARLLPSGSCLGSCQA